MRSYEERLNAMHTRAKQLRREKNKNRLFAFSAAALAVCFALVVSIALVMPNLAAKASPDVLSGMNASIFSQSGALGYIVVGIVAFFAGIAATVFCTLLKKRYEMNEREDDDDD